MESVTITGGAGSLGREFARLLHSDYRVTVLDNNEWSIAEFRNELPGVKFLLKDFDHHRTTDDYIIHCAAYKHVDLGESNVNSFIQNNLIKTMRFYESNKRSKILYISTDKAVEPISSYGATKMLAEALTREIDGTVARCGNFLMSSGSVIPLWEKQIANKEPITITDPVMVRYVSEMKPAVKEIWERFIKGEKLIVPEVRKIGLLELLEEVLKRHGYAKLADYEPGLSVIGMRDGEKLEEKLKWDKENI